MSFILGGRPASEGFFAAFMRQAARVLRPGACFGVYAVMRTEAGDLGLHWVMGSTAPQKIHNAVAAIAAGVIAPAELIVAKD
ncbi:MAG: hypothetical protein GKR94_27815 [Gammaproteobacteria bacterium]|nr:hypothetical protein [Gammaproteobacteria bacterium]